MVTVTVIIRTVQYTQFGVIDNRSNQLMRPGSDFSSLDALRAVVSVVTFSCVYRRSPKD